MKKENIVWGLILVFVGGVLLLENFGVIEFYWRSVWRLWPLILIISGANMLFSKSHNKTGTLVTIAITVLALCFVAYQGSRPLSGRSGWSFHRDNKDWENDRSSKAMGTNTFTEPFSAGTKRAEINIKGGATSYKLDDSTSNLFDASVQQQFGNYTLEKVSRDSMDILTFRMRDGKRKWNLDDMDSNEARIRLNTLPVWDINIEMGAGEVQFDLRKFKVQNISLKGGAAEFNVKLPEPQSVTNVTVETGVADVKVSVPSTAACRITVDSGLSSKDFEGFNKQADGTYTTANYNSSARRILINLKGGLSSFEVNRY